MNYLPKSIYLIQSCVEFNILLNQMIKYLHAVHSLHSNSFQWTKQHALNYIFFKARDTKLIHTEKPVSLLLHIHGVHGVLTGRTIYTRQWTDNRDMW